MRSLPLRVALAALVLFCGCETQRGGASRGIDPVESSDAGGVRDARVEVADGDGAERDAGPASLDAATQPADGATGPCADGVCTLPDAGPTDAGDTTDAGGTTDAGADGPDCQVPDAQTRACGLNARGRETRECTEGSWSLWSACVDPDVCVDGTSDPLVCGPNGRGSRDRVCVAGAWQLGAACSDDDECLDEKLDTQPCGLNGRGTQYRLCTQGTYAEWSACDDRDECPDGKIDVSPCELSSAGERQRECVAGHFTEWSTCTDGNRCVDGKVEERACGFNGRGTQSRTCVAGQFGDFSECADRDVCRDGAEQPQPCGLNARGTQLLSCAAGQWQAGEACVDPDSCVAGTTMDRCGLQGGAAHCALLDGRYACACDPLYIGDGQKCMLDECAAHEDSCSSHATCIDRGATEYGYSCVCHEGFTPFRSANGEACSRNLVPVVSELDRPYHLESDVQGNIYLSLDFGPKYLGTEYVYDAVLSKYGPDGTFKWSRSLPAITSVSVSSDGRVFTAGAGPGTYPNSAVHVVALDEDGDLLWKVAFANDTRDSSENGKARTMANARVAVDQAGAVYVAGDFFGRLELEGTVFDGADGYEFGDLFMAQLHPVTGSVLWASRTYGFRNNRKTDEQLVALSPRQTGATLVANIEGGLRVHNGPLVRGDGYGLTRSVVALAFTDSANPVQTALLSHEFEPVRAQDASGDLFVAGWRGNSRPYVTQLLPSQHDFLSLRPEAIGEVQRLLVTPDGGAFVRMDGNSQIDLGEGDTYSPGRSIARLDATGRPIWAHYASDHLLSDIALGLNGSVYVLVKRTRNGNDVYSVERLDPPAE